MKNRIIVGVDGSMASLEALRWAACEAASRRSCLQVTGVYSLSAIEALGSVGTGFVDRTEMDRLRADCLAQLARAVQRVVDLPGVDLHYEAIEGDPAECLATAGADADFVVVGSNGRGPARSFWLGSVTAGVLHRCPCPVVVVPEELGEYRGTIVVGVDGSESSDRALEWAADEAHRVRSELRILYARHREFRDSQEVLGWSEDFSEVDAGLVVERAVRLARERTTDPVDGLSQLGHPTEVLTAASKNADLVVVGSRGRGGFPAMLLGSVAQNVCAHARCPVVVVR